LVHFYMDMVFFSIHTRLHKSLSYLFRLFCLHIGLFPMYISIHVGLCRMYVRLFCMILYEYMVLVLCPSSIFRSLSCAFRFILHGYGLFFPGHTKIYKSISYMFSALLFRYRSLSYVHLLYLGLCRVYLGSFSLYVGLCRVHLYILVCKEIYLGIYKIISWYV